MLQQLEGIREGPESQWPPLSLIGTCADFVKPDKGSGAPL